MAFMVLFQSFLLWVVGSGVWNFDKYTWLLPALLVQNLTQIVGLAVFVREGAFQRNGPEMSFLLAISRRTSFGYECSHASSTSTKSDISHRRLPDASGHRWRHLQRLMNSHKIVVHEINRHHVRMIFGLL